MRLSSTKSHQLGLSGYELLFFLIMAGSLLLVAFKTVPMYYDNYLIDRTIQKVLDRPNISEKSAASIKQDIFQALIVENIRNWDRKTLKVRRDKDDQVYFELDYEKRENIAGNLDVVGVFKKTYRKTGDE